MYIGNNLQVADSGNKIIDDISSGFNGSTTSFALQVGGAAPVPFPINTQQVYISVNGVIQEPDPTGSAGFKLLGNNIVFSSAPANGHAFFGVILSGADYVTVGTEFPAGSATAPSITFGTDNNTGLYSVTGGTVGFTSDGVQTFTMDGNGFNFPDGKKVFLGSSSDLEIYHSGTHSYIKDGGTGSLLVLSNLFAVQNAAGTETQIVATEDGSVDLYYNDTKRFETTNTGTNVTGVHVDDGATHDGDVTFTGAAANVVWDKSADDLIFNDNAKATFGTSSDLEIFHDGSNSYIKDVGTGILQLNTNYLQVKNADDNETILVASQNGAVGLYYDNVKTFETADNGIKVVAPENNHARIHMWADDGDDSADKWEIMATTQGHLKFYHGDSSENTIILNGDGAVELYHDNVKMFTTQSKGITVQGPEGDDADILLNADEGDDNADKWRVRADSVASGFYIQNYASGSWEESLKCHGDGNVQLYHDNSLRLATTADGTDFSGTGSIKLPVGTTAQRNSSPTAGDMRYNSTTGGFEGYTSAWGALGGGATGAGGDTVFFENGQTVTTDYTITNNTNAGSFGPITINSGVTVTVGSGEVWTVV